MTLSELMTDMAATGGNCRAWSENVYTKLFLDPNNKSATLAVVKVRILFRFIRELIRVALIRLCLFLDGNILCGSVH